MYLSDHLHMTPNNTEYTPAIPKKQKKLRRLSTNYCKKIGVNLGL